MSIRELLTASSTDIDNIAPTGDTIRYDGLNVIVYIKCALWMVCGWWAPAVEGFERLQNRHR